jgi:hypothetical protein
MTRAFGLKKGALRSFLRKCDGPIQRVHDGVDAQYKEFTTEWTPNTKSSRRSGRKSTEVNEPLQFVLQPRVQSIDLAMRSTTLCDKSQASNGLIVRSVHAEPSALRNFMLNGRSAD